MFNQVLLMAALACSSAFAMDSQNPEQSMHQPAKRHIVDYKRLNADNIPDEQITKLHHEEDQRLQKIINCLGEAKCALNVKIPEEAQDREVIEELYKKYIGYQNDNSERWSEGFLGRREQK